MAPGGGNIFTRGTGDANNNQRTLLFGWNAGFEDEKSWVLNEDFLHESVPELNHFPHTVVCDMDKVRVHLDAAWVFAWCAALRFAICC